MMNSKKLLVEEGKKKHPAMILAQGHSFCDIQPYWLKLFIEFLLFVPSMSMGQTIPCVTERFLLDGIELEKQEIVLPNLESLEVVNLQEVDFFGKSQNAKIILAEDNPQAFTLVDNASLLKYKIENDTLFLMGKENNWTKVSYSLPEAIALYPLERSDRLQGRFEGEGRHVDKFCFGCDGTYQVSWAKMEAVITPDGDSLKNVYRLNRVIDTNYHLNSSQDSTFLTSESETYCFVLGYDYPILYQHRQIKPTSKMETFYYPVQVEQPIDAQTIFDKNKNRSKDNMKNGGEAQIEYTINNNIAGKQIHVTYKLSKVADITFIVSSFDGIALYYQRRHGQSARTEDFSYDYSGLKRGQYAVSIEVEGARYECKFNVK